MDEPSSFNLKKLAQGGDLNALASLIEREISLRNVKIKIEVSGKSCLRLKVFPLSKTNPNYCVQKIIGVLNCVQPPGIKMVTVWEMSKNENIVWDRFLLSKNGEFADSTNSVNLSLGIGFVLFAGVMIGLGYCALPKASVMQATELRSDIDIYPGDTQCHTFTIRNSPVSGNDRWIEGSVGIPSDARFLHAKVDNFSGFSYGKGTPTYNLCVSAKSDSIPGKYPISVSIWLNRDNRYRKQYVINVRGFN